MKRGYGFRYDAIGRLREAHYAAMAPGQTKWISEVDQYTVPEIRYDVNGNILKLKRNGWLTTSAFGQMDNLLYSYSGNQLTSVTDAATASGNFDFRDNGSTGANEFSYDANGNLTVDGNKSLSAEYNHLNLPVKVDFGGGNELLYLYDATGTKLARRMKQGGTPVSTRQYLGEFIYEGSQLEYFSTSEGRVVPVTGGGEEFRYEYFYRDHLGNTRMRFSDLDGDGVAEKGEILQEWQELETNRSKSYPYGLVFEGLGTPAVGTAHREGFNGKELENEFGLGWNAAIAIAVGARRYDPALGRWCGVDALAEKYVDNSPFVFVANNPLNNFERDGRDYVVVIDHQNQTITIRANYYVKAGDNASVVSARKAIRLWNKQSGKFSYMFGKENQNSYAINFELGIQEVNNPIAEANWDRSEYSGEKEKLTPDRSSNIYQVLPDSELDENTNGETMSGTIISVKKSKAGTDTGSHEVGHTLGLRHSNSGVMIESSSRRSQNSNVTRNNVSRILKNVQKPSNKIANGSVVEYGDTPSEFEKGNVK